MVASQPGSSDRGIRCHILNSSLLGIYPDEHPSASVVSACPVPYALPELVGVGILNQLQRPPVSGGSDLMGFSAKWTSGIF